MKSIKLLLLFGLFSMWMGVAYAPTGIVSAQSGDTPTPTATATELPTATATLEPTLPPTATPSPTLPPPTATDFPSGTRPIVVVDWYRTEPTNVSPGADFTLTLRLANQGQIRATNLIAVFTPGELVPLETGGVLAHGELQPGDSHKFVQPVHANSSLLGQSLATLVVTLTYGDDLAGSYTETFNLTIPLTQPSGSGVFVPSATPTVTPSLTPTSTSTPAARPQLIVSAYTTDPMLLKPGLQFTLFIDILNTGNSGAQRVTMITGGGTTSTGTSGTGTGTGTGGTSGGSGELSNFSPLGVSNVQAIGEVAMGGQVHVSQALIVNVTTNPGAYPLKISFAYNDSSGATFVDDQVITLLVQSPPLLELGFYRDPGALFAGQSNFLPVQIVNLGRKSAVLGTMRITAGDAYIENNSILIGTLEAGGYFTLDPMVIPNGPGSLEILIEVSYTDDFNLPQQISQTITVDVQDAPIIEPPIDGGEFPPDEGGLPPDSGGTETFWQKVVRFFKGLFGLDSGIQQPAVDQFFDPSTEPFIEPVQEEIIPPKGGIRPLPFFLH